jgi:uncharacterized surface protein with fasciclin (FAS1) repeats
MDSNESPTSGAGDDSRKGFWHSLVRADAALRAWAKTLPVARTLKYTILLLALALNLKIVFDGYSFYVARRDIDSELQSKKGYSFEYLDVLSRRKRALILVTLETRCLERAELTLFRIFDTELTGRLNEANQKFIDQKSAIIDAIRRLGPNVINTDAAIKYVNAATFRPAEFERYLKPVTGVTTDDVKYKKLREEVDLETKKYIEIGPANSDLLKKAEEQIRQQPGGGDPATYLSLDGIKMLEQRLARLKEEQANNQKQMGEIDDVMARYGTWTGALTGNVADAPILDEMAYELGKEGDKMLADVHCNRFKEYYEAVGQKLLQVDPLHGKKWQELTFAQKVQTPGLLYDQFLLRYFQQPPTAQTLFVTLFLGALGALTLNVLRLSKIGWWARETDPLWGEIIVSPLLGALAAFAIFLVGSAGLLLRTDVRAAQNGVTPLSAFFIGLLGFLSGLLYDEAFGRVRRVGENLFGTPPADSADNARAEDRTLAEALKKAGASLAAGLVLKHGIGTWLAKEEQFTLLVPSDEAVGNLSLATWNSLDKEKSDKDGSDLKKWYDRHHSQQRVTKKDVIGGTAKELKAADGTAYPLAIEGGDFKIANIRVTVADVGWGKGTIHVLSEDLP